MSNTLFQAIFPIKNTQQPIQHWVDEALAAGFDQLIIITEENWVLEKYKNAVYLKHDLANGPGLSLLRAQEIIKDNPFALFLVEEISPSEQNKNVLLEMRWFYEDVKANIMNARSIPVEFSPHHTMVSVDPAEGKRQRIQNIMYKPAPAASPSNLALAGRYILQPEIFPLLEQAAIKVSDELLFSEALAKLIHAQDSYIFL